MDFEGRQLGPYMKKLVIVCTSRVAIRPGQKSPTRTAAGVISNPKKMMSNLREGLKLADEMVNVMRSAPDNPYGEDEEAIAQAILKEAGIELPD